MTSSNWIIAKRAVGGTPLRGCLVLAFALAVFLVLPISSGAASFQRLGGLSGADTQFSKPSDLSADGSVVVGRSHSSNGMEAFRWTALGGMQGVHRWCFSDTR
jgi:hypothetical protein